MILSEKWLLSWGSELLATDSVACLCQLSRQFENTLILQVSHEMLLSSWVKNCKMMFQVFSAPFWPQFLLCDFALEFVISSTYLIRTGTFWLVAASLILAFCRFADGLYETGDIWNHGVPCQFYQWPCSWPWTNPWWYEQHWAWWPGETAGVCCWILLYSCMGKYLDCTLFSAFYLKYMSLCREISSSIPRPTMYNALSKTFRSWIRNLLTWKLCSRKPGSQSYSGCFVWHQDGNNE